MRLEPFQRRLLADYFAGTTESLVLLPKKNGKTTLLAALALHHLIETSEAECVIGAASRDQATILFDQAAGFVRRTPALQEDVVVRRGYRSIVSKHHAGRIRVLAADVDTVDGVTPTLALVDELHRHKSAGLYGVFRDGLGPRDGRMITISTAGDHEGSPLGVMRQTAKQLPVRRRRGRHTYARSEDRSFVLHEWALEEADDVTDMRTVKLANPGSWHTVKSLGQRHATPSMLDWQWRRFACGIWAGAESWWVDGEMWQQAGRELALEPGDRVTLGFDGARLGDATALVACRLSDGLLVLLGVWEPPLAVPDWETPAGEVDAAVADAFERFTVARMYADPPLWQSEIDSWARDYGEPVMRYQTNRTRMMNATERFRTDLAAGRLVHATHPVLTKHVLNAQVREARGGYWLSKDRRDSPNKIDAAVAAVLAWEARADVLAGGPERPRGQLVTF